MNFDHSWTLQIPLKNAPQEVALLELFMFASENASGNHLGLKRDVPGLQKWPQGVQNGAQKQQK